MLHPVGKLPAAVYWRRRVLVLLVLVSAVGGGGWLAATGIGRWQAHAGGAAAASSTPALPTPALEQVVPSPAALHQASARPCSDSMIGLSVRAPARATVGAQTTMELVVTNTSATACVSALDRTLQEVVLLDAHGTRVWGSDDCVAGAGSETRTLAAGQSVSLPVTWDGRTSEPTCSGARVPPPPGQYVLRGRLGTKVTPDIGLTLAQL